MTTPSENPAAQREEASEPSDLQDFRERLAFIGRQVWTESKTTLRAAWEQAQRVISYVRAWWTSLRLERKFLAAEIALGERLEGVGRGDAGLRGRLADLHERRQSFVAARESTRSIDAERRGLHVRLAEPFLEAVQSPPDVEAQHRRALALRMEIAELRAQQTARRDGLFPADSATRIRTAAGLGVCAILLSMLFSLFFGSENVSALLLPPAIDLENLQPLASFPVPGAPPEGTATGSVEKKTFEVDADAILPVRTVSVTFINGRPDGEARSVDAQGRVICIEQFRNGVLNGTRERFYPGGEKFSELRFVDGVAQGTELVWFANGMVAARTTVVDGVPQGAALIYFENGRKCVSTTYVQGRPHGQRSHYRPDEVCFAIVDWQEGAPVSQQFLDVEVSAEDVEAIERRGGFSTRLVEHWEE
jgi:hypothetical protein